MHRSRALALLIALSGCDDAASTPGSGPAVGPAAATASPTVSAVPDAVRVLAAEVAALREQPALAEMFLREVADPSPWSALPGWAELATELRGRPVRQVHHLRHAGLILGWDATPDGSRVAAVADGGQVRVWTIAGDVATSVDLTGARGRFYKLAISRDGARVVAGGGGFGNFGRDAPVWLWSVEKGLVGELRGHEDAVLELAFSPDGQSLASSSMDGTVRVWDAATAEPRHVIRVAASMFPDMPPGGPSIMAAVSGLAWRPDGQRLATGDYTGKIFEWVVGQDRPAATLVGHTEDVRILRYSADGQRLVSGADDNTARVWVPATGTLEHTFTFDHPVDAAVFNPDHTRLATLAYASDARVWDLASERDTRLQGSHWPNSIDFNADGKYLVTSDRQYGVLWRGHGAAMLGTMRGHTRDLLGARFTGDGRILTASRDGSVRVWQIDRGTPEPGPTRPYGHAFHPDGRRVLIAGRGDEPTRELDGGAPLWSTPALEFEAAAYSRDGGTIGLATRDGEVMLLRSRTGEVVRRWRSGPSLMTPQALAFRGDGALACITLYDVIVWNAEGREILARRGDSSAGEPDYNTLAWSPDGAQLALADRAHRVQLWRTDLPAPDRRIDLADGVDEQYDGLASLAWSPDGARLAVGASSGTVFEIDVASLRPLARWHTDPIADDGLRYSPDGDRILVTDIGGDPHAFPSVRDPATLRAALWQTNRACPTIAERQRWLHLDEPTATRDHDRCAAYLTCITSGKPDCAL